MRKEFKRSEQKFWVLRRGNPWSIIDFATNKKVGDITPDEYYALEEGDICLCDTLEEIQALIKKTNMPVA